MLTKPNTSGNTKPKQSLPEYVQGRINQAAQNNFRSTKMWIKNTGLNEAQELLNSSGFKFTEVDRDDKSVQLEVSW